VVALNLVGDALGVRLKESQGLRKKGDPLATHKQQPEPNDCPAQPMATGRLELNKERREFLAPRLAALLADFTKLEALVSSDAEPAMTTEVTDRGRRERE
jgi:hypothetical protein